MGFLLIFWHSNAMLINDTVHCVRLLSIFQFRITCPSPPVPFNQSPEAKSLVEMPRVEGVDKEACVEDHFKRDPKAKQNKNWLCIIFILENSWKSFLPRITQSILHKVAILII